ncbi:MAG: STAS domain-containing protein [Thermoanaerobaculia bacterium]|nr:STAS domain-containing protein [Thermoanaerobaculia bacterium]
MTVVTVKGDLVIGDPEAVFRRTIISLLVAGKVDILIDCSGLRIVDSSGLGALVRALTTSQNEGGRAKLLGVGSNLKKLLEMTRLDSVFETFDDREQAVFSF